MPDLRELPDRMKRLPLDHRGYPVPKFVEWIDGKPDFRVMSPKHLVKCISRKLCWVCGEPMGRFMCFIIGPMCSVNRVSAEPPSHLECARFSVKVCPFLSVPHRRRNDVDMPEGGHVAGVMIAHNPGATLLWITERYKTFRDGNGGILFNIGEPYAIEWWSRGRSATRAEVQAAFDKGLPLLRAEAEKDGPSGVAEMEKMVAKALPLLPPPDVVLDGDKVTLRGVRLMRKTEVWSRISRAYDGFLITIKIQGKREPLSLERAEIMQNVIHHVMLDRYEGEEIKE